MSIHASKGLRETPACPRTDDSDTVDYSRATSRICAFLNTGSGAEGYAANDKYVSIENVIGSDYNDTIHGNEDNNLLKGGKGPESDAIAPFCRLRAECSGTASERVSAFYGTDAGFLRRPAI